MGKKIKDIDKYSFKDCDYYLDCFHYNNSKSGVSYQMSCKLLKIMPDNQRAKVIVFGNMMWKVKDFDMYKQIRYVDMTRLVKKRLV